jgi:hypothetical protein
MKVLKDNSICWESKKDDLVSNISFNEITNLQKNLGRKSFLKIIIDDLLGAFIEVRFCRHLLAKSLSFFLRKSLTKITNNFKIIYMLCYAIVG